MRGFDGRAAYRGEKLTKSAAAEKPLKFDLRNDVDRGQVSGTASPAPARAQGAEYASYVFLLDDEGSIRALPHALYVALARGEAAGHQLAGRQVRVADWHVRLRDGEPEAVVSEWYGWARFDGDGRFDPAFGEGAGADGRERGNVDESALPTNDERRRMMGLLFPAGGE